MKINALLYFITTPFGAPDEHKGSYFFSIFLNAHKTT